MSIVVMGGSFNPPTAAHLAVMKTALDAVNARTGFFIPVGFPYLKRKMMKAGQSHLSLSSELRVRMLEAMTASDERMRIFTEAMDQPYSDDVGMMRLMRDRYPDEELYYVAGADKLDLLDHFAEKGTFFEICRCILYARDCGRLEEEIAARGHLAPHRDSLITVGTPAGLEGVSSTAIREHLFDVDVVIEMLHPSVVPILRELRQQDYPEEILQFRDEYAFLSNGFPAEVTYGGITYPCAASAFLASKCEKEADRKTIARMNPDKAKQKYAAKQGSPAWEARKTEVMEEIVRLKFSQNPELVRRLIETGNLKLINGAKKDTFWGVDLNTWEGENRLGTILMKVRTEET